jgi:uncharacterized phiE125 gp8 family phage protein
MSAICIVPPATLAVDLSLIKKNMRIDDDHMDDLIELWAKGVIADLESKIGQCLMPQTWRITLDSFQHLANLPHPATSVVSLKYIDADGVERLLADGLFTLIRAECYSQLVPTASAWPSTRPGAAAVVIEVVCGMASSPADVPANMKLYILAKLVEQFDPQTRTERDTVQSTFIARLLDACKTYA